MGRKGAEKQKGAPGSPKRYSDAFCCVVFIAKHGHILFPSLPLGKRAAVIGFKLPLKICTTFSSDTATRMYRVHANPETVVSPSF